MASDPIKKAERVLRKTALGYPETHEDHPWGSSAFKVRTKVFLLLGVGDKGLSASFKLPNSHAAALMLPFAEPTHYGLGKHGWVTVSFAPDNEELPLDMLCEWMDESFRAIAPKKLVGQL